YLLLLPPPQSNPTLFPYTTLFRSQPRQTHSIRIARAVGLSLGRRMKACSAFTAGSSNKHCPSPASTHRPPARSRDATPDCEQTRSEEHTSELQSRFDLVCRLLLEK